MVNPWRLTEIPNLTCLKVNFSLTDLTKTLPFVGVPPVISALLDLNETIKAREQRLVQKTLGLNEKGTQKSKFSHSAKLCIL